MSVAASTSTRPARHVEGIVPERTLLGITLVAIGLIVAAGFFIEGVSQYTLVTVSATLLGAFALSREYGYAIPAGITGGIGTGTLLIVNQTFAPQSTPAVFFLSIAAGFLAVWILGLGADPQERHPWPLVPSIVLGAIGLAFASGQPAAVDWIRVAIAVVIVIAGVGMLLRREGDEGRDA